MNRLNLLFDTTTIINISFFAKLFKRYLKSSLILIGTLLCVFLLLFFFQKKLYWSSISFSDTANDSSDFIMKNFIALMGEKKGGVRATEILSLRSSADFNRKISSELLKSKNYQKLRLDLSFFGTNSNDILKIENRCHGEKECVVSELTTRLPAFYQISDKTRSGVNFVVEVKALDEFTSKTILSAVSNAILETRMENLSSNIKDQEHINAELLSQKLKEIDFNSYYSSLQRYDQLDADIKDLQIQQDRQSTMIVELQDNYSKAESAYHYSKKVLKTKRSLDELNVDRKRNDLKIRIEKLNADITSLEGGSGVQKTTRDEEIISQLKKELQETTAKLEILGEGANQNSLDLFIQRNDQKIHSKEFDSTVLKKQLEIAKEQYEEINDKKKEVLEKKTKLDQEINILKPKAELIKKLEEKVDQLKYLSSIITADVRFDTYSTTSAPVRRIGLILFVAYLIVSLIATLTIYLSLRFIFDDRIHDIKDAETISRNLKIIGA